MHTRYLKTDDFKDGEDDFNVLPFILIVNDVLLERFSDEASAHVRAEWYRKVGHHVSVARELGFSTN